MNARRITTRCRLMGAVLVALPLGGCIQSAINESQFIGDYNAGRYEQAQRRASEQARREGPPPEPRAALIAGMSAQAMGRQEEARTWLMPLTTHANDEISGKASASMGLLCAQRGEHVAAADHFTRASKKLRGDHGARSAMLAGDALARTGKPAGAMVFYQQAQARAQAPALRQEIRDRTSGPFAVQLAAFGAKEAADTLARSKMPLARSLGQWTRVEPAQDKHGKLVYAVRMGKFSTRPEAQALQEKLGAGTTAVVPVRR